MSVDNVPVDDVAPLASVGVISALPYTYRRDAVRETWARFPEVANGSVLLRFVVACTPNPDESADVICLPQRGKGASSRVTAPLLTTWQWLTYAVKHAPHRASRFVIKADDDAYIQISSLASLMSLMVREVPSPYVCFGRMYCASMAVVKPPNARRVAGALHLQLLPPSCCPSYTLWRVGAAAAQQGLLLLHTPAAH